MIYDLESLEPAILLERSADVCIVGAGPAGLYLAHALLESGLRVIIAELGGNTSKHAEEAFAEPIYREDIYSGAKQGRVAGLGGTSAKWGGQMIKLASSDFQRTNPLSGSPVWPFDINELSKNYRSVSSTLGLDEPTNFQFSESAASKIVRGTKVSKYFNLRRSTWIPFKLRNFGNAFRKKIARSSSVDIWLNCKLPEDFVFPVERNALTSLTFCDSSDRRLVISSNTFVFAMGALETTKFVLSLLSQQDPGRNTEQPFCDHVSAVVGLMKIKKRTSFLAHFSPFFVRGIMKSMRFELSQELQVKESLPSAFVHFVTEQDAGSALDIIRSIIRRRQGEQTSIAFSKISPLAFAAELLKIFWWRVCKGKMILNGTGEVKVLVDIEQLPRRSNNISLKESGLEVCWKVDREDIRAIITAARYFEASWNESPVLADLAEVKLREEQDLATANYFDVYHPTGSLAMGSESSAILTEDLRVRGTKNLYVTSTAVFPLAGSANPGFTHLALTDRLAKHLSDAIARPQNT